MGNVNSAGGLVQPSAATGMRPATVAGSWGDQFAKKPGTHIVWVPEAEFSRRQWYPVITCLRCGVKHGRDDLNDRRSEEEYMRAGCACGGKLARVAFFPPTADDWRRQREEFDKISCPKCLVPKQDATCTCSHMGFATYRCACGTHYGTVIGTNVAFVLNSNV